MATVTMEMTKGAYPYLKDVWGKKLTRLDGMEKINRTTGMNRNTAGRLIDIFVHMMEGAPYKSHFNNQTFEFLLGAIRDDYGARQFQKAVEATRAHIEYFEDIQGVNMVGLRTIVDGMAR